MLFLYSLSLRAAPQRQHQQLLPRLLLSHRRDIHASRPFFANNLPPRPTINEGEITEAFLKGSGPGGQKINKTSSAVQLKHLPTGLMIKCQETRSRSQNRKIARRLLAERIDELEKGSESRTAIKAETKKKKKASKDKKARRKYRKLEEEEGKADGDEGGDEDVGEGEGEEGREIGGLMQGGNREQHVDSPKV